MGGADQLDLFNDDPIHHADPLPPLAERWGAVGAKWSAYRGPHRSCSDCTERIHQLGAGKAPLPRAATRRRQGPNDDRYLCPEDAQARKELDDKAEAERKARLKENAEQTPAERAAWAKRRSKTREGMR